jgi:hypothetical protein
MVWEMEYDNLKLRLQLSMQRNTEAIYCDRLTAHFIMEDEARARRSTSTNFSHRPPALFLSSTFSTTAPQIFLDGP